MKRKSRYAHTTTERHPYIKAGWYWTVFGHLFTVTASEAFKKRMLALREQDERQSTKKFAG